MLRAGRQRLRHRCTAQRCDELASFQMIKLHLTAPARDFAAAYRIGQDRVRGLPRCEISARLTAASGQSRSFGDVGSMSGLPEIGHGWATYEYTPYSTIRVGEARLHYVSKATQ